MRMIWLILLVVGSTYSARLLGMFPSPSISHQMPFQAVMKALAYRGHQVTVVSPDPLKTRVANHTDIDLSFTYDYWRKEHDFASMDTLTPYQMMDVFLDMGTQVVKIQFESKVMQDFIKSKPQFDLVFIEDLMYHAYYGLIHEVGSPPIIGFLSLGGMPLSYDTMGNPNHPAYVPNIMWPYDDHMTFFQRLNNLYYGLWMRYHFLYTIMPPQEELMRRYFGPTPPSIYETQYNFSLYLVNNHHSLSYPQPLLPNFIELGGLHLQTETKPLPKDLAEFLDGATEGFIYFSLGSNVRSDKLPAHKRQQFLDAFAELPQRVLWKWESDSLPGQPSNVKLGKWLPQQDVLAHPNIVAFMTQGGLQSMQEATRSGVPLIGIPFVGDQKHNIHKVVTAGVGVALDFQSATKQSILDTIRTVINNSSYRENMKRLSVITQDQPESAVERAVWWTEYVLRHNGAKHLRSAALDLAWYQYLLLDVVAFLLAVTLLAVAVVYVVVKKVYGVLRRITTGKTKLS